MVNEWKLEDVHLEPPGIPRTFPLLFRSRLEAKGFLDEHSHDIVALLGSALGFRHDSGGIPTPHFRTLKGVL
jgi:hypothetical protein